MDAKSIVRVRDGTQCQRCSRWIVDFPSSIHHRKLRSQGGLDTPDNMIRLCGSGTTYCHGWCHHNRLLAQADGFIVYRIDVPSEIPVKTFHGLALLTTDGEFEYVREAV